MIRTLIQISGIALTIEAAIFLAKGNLGLSAAAIAELASMKVGYNPELIGALSRQRAETWVGVMFLLAAFLLQMWSAMWPMRSVDFEVSTGGVVAAVVICGILGTAGHLHAVRAGERTAAEAKLILDRRGSSGVQTQP